MCCVYKGDVLNAKTNPSPFATIRAEHDRIRELLSQILDGNHSDKAVKNLYGDLRREITLHSMNEEEMLYKLLKNQPSTQATARISAVHHAAMDRHLTTLDSLAIRTDTWYKAMHELRDEVLDHMEFEEKELHFLLPAPQPIASLLRSSKSASKSR